MSDEELENQIDEQLGELSEQAGQLIEKALYRSSFKLFGELRQRAKRERRLYHYVIGTFHQMDQAQYMFEFQDDAEGSVRWS